MYAPADRTIVIPRFSVIEVGSAFLVQDTQRPDLFIKIEQWEIRPPSQSFREYAERVLTVLNATTAM